MPLIQRLIILLVLLYRRWFSGRLASVHCTFTDDETCSAFGLRVARAARSGREAIACIVRRLRRCGDACLLADGARIGWTELHDRSPADIVAELRADGEGDAAIARVLRTRLAVALWSGDCASAHACRDELGALPRAAERPRVIASTAVGLRALGRYRFADRGTCMHRASPAAT